MRDEMPDDRFAMRHYAGEYPDLKREAIDPRLETEEFEISFSVPINASEAEVRAAAVEAMENYAAKKRAEDLRRMLEAAMKILLGEESEVSPER